MHANQPERRAERPRTQIPGYDRSYHTVSIDHLQQLFQAATPEAWRTTMCGIVRRYGFSHILFALLPNKSAPLSTMFLSENYPTDWRTTYDKSAFHIVDPTIAHCRDSTLPIVWRPGIYKNRAQQEFHEEACGFGLGAGLSLPVHGPHGEAGMFSLVSEDSLRGAQDLYPEQLAMLSLLRDYAFESSARFRLRPPCPTQRTKLTSRELECLKWVMAGKSSWEIAKISHCSEATINFHIENIKRKFDVLTRQQAVIKAIKENILHPG